MNSPAASRALVDPVLHPEWYPYQSIVPRERRANCQFRKDLHRRCLNSKNDREAVREMCARDLLFWINAFGWVYSPLLFPNAPEQPFVTWPAQDRLFSELHAAIEKRYFLGLYKSRDQGASIMVIFALLWYLLGAKIRMSLAMVSRNKDMVDRPNDSDSLFWKMDFALERTPEYLLPDAGMERSVATYLNPANGVSLMGYATTKDIIRGGRKNVIVADEFNAFAPKMGWKSLKAMQFATRCLIVNGTFGIESVGTAFEWVITQSNWRKATIWWEQNPFHAAGLYAAADGKLRSPWYDDQVSKAPIGGVSGELDGDPRGDAVAFYNEADIEAALKKCIAPVMVGELLFDADSRNPRFVERADGHWKLWFVPDKNGRPAQGRSYTQGVDTAVGTGSSPSCICVYDATTGLKVAEYSNNTIDPMPFGQLGLAAARWFGGEEEEATFQVWEANGQGRSYGRVQVEAGYGNYYYRRQEDADHDKPTEKPGWWAATGPKLALHDRYRNAVRTGKITNLSRGAVEEMREFRYGNGGVVHARAANTLDESARDDNHGDLVTADALACLGLEYSGQQSPEPVVVPENCFLARRREYDDKKRREKSWSRPKHLQLR